MSDAWALIAGHERQRAADPHRRRQEGAYYTPPALAAEVASKALGPFLGSQRGGPNPVDPAALGDLRILDPAVGGGTFLLAVVDRLVAAGLKPETAARCCTGFDRDPGAIEVARTAMRLHCGGEARLEVVDALLCDPVPEFDVVLGNPPWEKISRLDPRRPAFDQRFADIRQGEINLHALFLVWGLRSLKPGGILAMITPNTWLLNRWDALLRRHVLGFRLEEVALLPPGTFPDTPVTVPAVVVVRHAPPGGEVRVMAPGFESRADSATWLSRPHFAMSVFDDVHLAEVEAALWRRGVPLGDLARASDGIYASTARRFAFYPGTAPGTDASDLASFLDARPVLLSGGEVALDLVLHGGAYIPRELWSRHEAAQHHDRLVLHAARHPSLGRRLVGAVVPAGVYASNRFINVVSRSEDPYFLAAVLLSRTLDRYFARRFPVADVDAFMLHQLPVPVADAATRSYLAALGRQRATLRRALTGLLLADRLAASDKGLSDGSLARGTALPSAGSGGPGRSGPSGPVPGSREKCVRSGWLEGARESLEGGMRDITSDPAQGNPQVRSAARAVALSLASMLASTDGAIETIVRGLLGLPPGSTHAEFIITSDGARRNRRPDAACGV